MFTIYYTWIHNSYFQALQPGQGIPTGTPGHLLVKTETGQYQILRVGPPGATGTTVSQQPQQQQQPTIVRQTAPPSTVVSSQQQQHPAPQIRLPTQPVALTRPQQSTSVTPQLPTTAVSTPPASTASPSASSPAVSAANQAAMGQQMTPDTAKVKCRNFLATLLRLASDQPDSVAKNVRELIQG